MAVRLIDFIADGLCAQTDPEIFFPDLTQQYIHAEQVVCGGCEVREKCLQWALEQDANPDGIWGATTEVERMAMRRESRAA